MTTASLSGNETNTFLNFFVKISLSEFKFIIQLILESSSSVAINVFKTYRASTHTTKSGIISLSNNGFNALFTAKITNFSLLSFINLIFSLSEGPAPTITAILLLFD